jgi:hypothetical protein
MLVAMDLLLLLAARECAGEREKGWGEVDCRGMERYLYSAVRMQYTWCLILRCLQMGSMSMGLLCVT